MGSFWFYIQLGLEHVLDFNAYDHILFLSALAVPFTFKDWKNVLVLATVFTVTHCVSLAISAYGLMSVDVSLIEFLIPVTIFFTAVFNVLVVNKIQHNKHMLSYVVATGFFGLVHGFGFSNYFNMLMAGETEKLSPLLGFAAGIEISQVLIIIMVLLLAVFVQKVLKLKQASFVQIMSIIILCLTVPMLIDTFPQ
ncbi:hypothetical protein KCTC52924_01189 [Arenibacter antarcticus]|uniref:HupE/UreJ family protein n=1 Tax=Arenibacter antarcticus TaxID=2040469 RepID=A0ABW5VAH6_9FLAO|nr:HupE/UreJ family protein [Arenibacter sp. H213]MCM4167990.1 HupE / UreJ protein [Arenibacter sp. H213]